MTVGDGGHFRLVGSILPFLSDPGPIIGNLKLVVVVTVADVDDEDRVGNSLLKICKLRFRHKGNLLFRLGQSRPTAGEA